jgi:hypothetical protein
MSVTEWISRLRQQRIDFLIKFLVGLELDICGIICGKFCKAIVFFYIGMIPTVFDFGVSLYLIRNLLPYVASHFCICMPFGGL